MIRDSVRTGAYTEALRRAVEPGAVVLDIGAGTGIFSLLACRYGASRVYAIEPSDVIEVARRIAAANGCADRITFIQDFSTRIELPERADVLIQDINGILPLFERSLPSIIDARERLMKPDGILIPREEMLWATLVQTPELYEECVGECPEKPYGIDMSATRPMATNSFYKARFESKQLLTEPQCCARLDFAQAKDSGVHNKISWTMDRSGTAHGLGFWFDSILAPGICISNAPGCPKLIYGNTFFPFSEPVRLERGDVVHADLRADLVGDDYIWSWNTRVEADGRVKANFKQSTFYGAPLSLSKLKKQAADFRPKRNEEGEIKAAALNLMDGGHALEEIARELLKRFPRRFASVEEALARAGDFSKEYSL